MSNETVIRTACPAHCGNSCGILAHVAGGRVTRLEPAPFPDNRYTRICQKGLASLQMVYHPDRLKYPMRRAGARGEGKWQRLSWDEALDYVATRLKEVSEKYGSRSLAWVLGGPGSGTTKFGAYLRLAGLLQGTRVSSWGYGDAGGPCGTMVTFHAHRLRSYLASFPEPKLNICWGTNPAESGPFEMRPLLDAKERGIRLVTVDPVFTITASKSDEYLPVRPGADVALILAMMNRILADGLEDRAFIARYTVGPFLVRDDNGLYLRRRDLPSGQGEGYVAWDNASDAACPIDSALKPALEGACTVNGIRCRPAFQLLKDLVSLYPPSRAAGITGVSEDKIVRLARAYANSRPVAVHTHNGLSRTYHGDIIFRALGAIAALTGNVHLPGPTGHREVEYNWSPFLNPRPGKPSYSRMGIMNLYDAIESGRPYPVRAAWFAFINFVNQCTNNRRILSRVFPKLDFIVVADMFMTDTARYADVVLPACSFLEFTDLVNGPHPYVQLQQRVVPPLHESRSDVEMLRALAPRLGLGEYFAGEEDFVDLLLKSGDSSVEGISLASLKNGPGRLNLPYRPPVAGEPAHFRTPTGRIEFYVEKLLKFGEALPVYKEPLEVGPSPLAKKYPLAMVTVHSKFHVHSMYYLNTPWMRELNPEPVLEMNPSDASLRRISDGDMVEVFNDRARAKLKARLNPGIQPGMVNLTHGWWPSDFKEGDLNALTNDAINPAQEAAYEPNMPMNDNRVEVRKA